jgi:hypothetical protein
MYKYIPVRLIVLKNSIEKNLTDFDLWMLGFIYKNKYIYQLLNDKLNWFIKINELETTF